MTNTIDKVAAEPAEQEPAGLAIGEIEGRATSTPPYSGRS
jgi:hypothetical protein